MVVGLLYGWFARKLHSTGLGIAVCAALGFPVAAMDAINEEHSHLQIMLPGFVVGAIVGFLTQRMGSGKAVSG
jgi:uncharacterized membrane protein YeaQ/YmgE (transglycosylase-associated protein family)